MIDLFKMGGIVAASTMLALASGICAHAGR
jgi:hypothetical protein